jgi:thiamine biosynthesis lipoprotein
MGTRFELVLEGGDPEALRPAGELALEEIEQWHRRLTRFAPDSVLSHMHRTAHLRPVRLDPETFALFEDALRVHRDSGGAFDIAVGGTTSSAAIVLDPAARTVRFTRRGLSLDLGGIAKGHALDCAADLLRAHGVESALLHGGTSSVVAIGAPPDAPGWRVALGPRPGAETALLMDEALSVSSIDLRAHIVDPRSGEPVRRHGLVVVRGPSARLADAWSTALLVLGVVPPAFPAGYTATTHAAS